MPRPPSILASSRTPIWRISILVLKLDARILRDFEKYKNKVEVNISKNGIVFMNGMGNFDEIMQKMDLVKI